MTGPTGITGKDCNTYPAYPGCVPTTTLPTDPPGFHTADTGHDFMGSFALGGALVVAALTALFSARNWGKGRHAA
jgi:hypothetical protein